MSVVCKPQSTNHSFIVSKKGEIRTGIPTFQFPNFSVPRPVIGSYSSDETSPVNNLTSPNETTETMAVTEVLRDLGAGLALIPIVAILEQVAIAKAFCK